MREYLNGLKWRDDRDIESAVVWYIHRGAPGGERAIRGSDIHALGHSFIEIAGRSGEVWIPYHRVTRVEIEGRVTWDRVRESDARSRSAPA